MNKITFCILYLHFWCINIISGIQVASSIFGNIKIPHSRPVYVRVSLQRIHQTIYKHEGETLTLVCPLTRTVTQTLLWSGPPNAQTYFINEDKNPNLSRGDRVSVVENPATGGYSLVITGLTRTDDVGLYNCVIVGTSQVYTIQLDIYVVPEDIIISNAVTEKGILRIKGHEDSSILLTCQSLNGVPPADVTWYRGSQNLITGKNQAMYIFTPTKSDDLQNFTCTSTSAALTVPKESIVQLYLNLKPLKPTIGRLLVTKEGENLAVTCSSTGSRPVANISWIFYRHVSAISSSFVIDNNTQTFTVNSTARLQVTKQDNGQSLICNASNAALTTGIQSSQNVYVLFGPSSIGFEGADDLQENTVMELKCSSSEANRIPVYVWRNNSKLLTVSSGIEFSLGIYNGVITSQTLTKNLTRYDHNSVVTCAVSNDDITVSKSITLDVKYSPVVSMSPSNVTVVVGQRNVTLQCNIEEANPTDVTYVWSPAISPSTNVYTIRTVQKSHDGQYKCSASNSAGTSSSAVVSVIVNYPPEIQDGTSETADKGETVTLHRTIDSKPPVITVDWYRHGVRLDSVTSSQNTSYTIQKAQCTDTGNYTITATNGVPHDHSTNVQLFVRCKPRLSHSHRSNITLGITENAGLEIKEDFISFPRPTSKLLYVNNTVPLGFTITVVQNSVNNFTIKVNKSRVELADYTQYKLEVENDQGKSVSFINILPKGKPAQPVIIDVNCELGTSAVIKWVSSFNGGDAQVFKLIVSTTNGKQYITTNAVKDRGDLLEQSYIVGDLQPCTVYRFNVSATNSYGTSYSTEEYKCTTQGLHGNAVHSHETDNLQVLVIVFGLLFGVFFCFSIILSGAFIYNRRKRRRTPGGRKRKERDIYDELQDVKQDTSNRYESITRTVEIEIKEREIYTEPTQVDENQYEQTVDITDFLPATEPESNNYLNTSIT